MRNLTRREWSLTLASGALLAFSFPPFPTAPLAWIALIPLIRALDGRPAGHSIRIGYAFGLIYHLGLVFWIAFHTQIPGPLAVAGWVAASAILALYVMVATGVSRYSARWIGGWWPWTLPFTWTASEYLRFVTEFAFPWSTIGHSQARMLGLIQQADIWGVLGVSFWLVCLNVIAHQAYRSAFVNQRRAWQYAGAFALVLLAAFTYGRYRLSEQPTQPVALTVAIVQPNIDMDVKWGPGGVGISRRAYIEQSREIESPDVDLVIWPETALPDYMIYNPPGSTFVRVANPRYRGMFRAVTEHTGVPLVLGSPVHDYRIDNAYNSGAILMPGDLAVQTYEKRLLVPFGEHVPYDRLLGWLENLNLGIAHWAVGERNVLLNTAGANAGDSGRRFGIAICFESVFPSVMRSFVRQGADFLVIVTNDAWFGNTPLIYQHAEFAAFRAIETRSWIARAANTGISGIYDPWGRVTQKGPAFARATLIGSVGMHERDTVYLALGDWIAWVSIAATLLLLLGTWRRTRRDGARVG